MSAPTRLIRCRCVLEGGQRVELLVVATGAFAAACELLDALGPRLLRISAFPVPA